MLTLVLVEVHIIIVILLDIPFLFIALSMVVIVAIPHFISVIVVLVFLFLEHFLVLLSCVLTTFVNSAIPPANLHIVFLCPPWIPFVATIVLVIIIKLRIRFLFTLLHLFIFAILRHVVAVVQFVYWIVIIVVVRNVWIWFHFVVHLSVVLPREVWHVEILPHVLSVLIHEIMLVLRILVVVIFIEIANPVPTSSAVIFKVTEIAALLASRIPVQVMRWPA